jgi:hypothetical protein
MTIPGLDKLNIPGLGGLKDLAHLNEVVAAVPTLVLKAVALHALILRGTNPEEALKMITQSRSGISELAKE